MLVTSGLPQRAEDGAALQLIEQGAIELATPVAEVLPAFANLAVLDDPLLPRLPELRVGAFYRDGLDVSRIRKLADAFVAAVKPKQSAVAEFKHPILVHRSRSG